MSGDFSPRRDPKIVGSCWLPGKLTVCELEHGPVEIVDLPINSMVIFHSFVYVYQRVII
jgi:hypothetical protein